MHWFWITLFYKGNLKNERYEKMNSARHLKSVAVKRITPSVFLKKNLNVTDMKGRDCPKASLCQAHNLPFFV